MTRRDDSRRPLALATSLLLGTALLFTTPLLAGEDSAEDRQAVHDHHHSADGHGSEV